MGLVLELELGDSVKVGETVVVLTKIKGSKRAKLTFIGDNSIPIKRMKALKDKVDKS